MARLENDLYKANKLFTDLDSKFSKSINDLAKHNKLFLNLNY